MSERWIRGGILLLCVLSLTMLIAGIPVRYADLMEPCAGASCPRRTLTPDDVTLLQEIGWTQQGYAIFQIVTELIYLAVMGPLAVFLFRQRDHPHRRMLVLTAYILFSLATILFPEISLALAYSSPGWYLLYQIIKGIALVGFFLFLFTFPDGRFVPSWLRWLLPVNIVAAGIWILTGSPDWDPAERYGILVAMTFLWIGVIAQIYRYRKVATAEGRQQTKWLLFGFILSLLSNFLWIMAFLAFELESAQARLLFNTVGWLFLITGPLSISISLTMGILRYRLWDIDIIINRTLVYATLTGFVVGTYTLVVGILGGIFQSQGSLVFSLLATALVAVLFQPLRQRVQQAINRLMFGQRDEPYSVISQLGQRLEGAYEPAAVLPTIVETVAQALKLPYAAILLQQDGNLKITAAFGAPRGDEIRLPLVYTNEPIGELVLSSRSPGEAFTRADYSLLETLAQQIGVAAHAALLTADLERSRQRIVTEREEARRRLGSDLHDGLGHRLAGTMRRVEMALNHLDDDPESTRETLQMLTEQLQTTISDVRALAHSLYPPELELLGLGEALQESARQYHISGDEGLQVALDVPAYLPPLPMPGSIRWPGCNRPAHPPGLPAGGAQYHD